MLKPNEAEARSGMAARDLARRRSRAVRGSGRWFWATVADEARALGLAIHGGGVSLFEAKERDREIVSERAPERKNKKGRDRGRRGRGRGGAAAHLVDDDEGGAQGMGLSRGGKGRVVLFA